MFHSRDAKVSVTKYRFLQQLLAPKLGEHTPGTLHRSLEKPSEPLSASTVWGIRIVTVWVDQVCVRPLCESYRP